VPLTSTTTAQVLDILTRAMRFVGILAGGETPSAEDTADVALIANGMLDAWAMDRLYVFTESLVTAALTSGTQNYAIGPSAAAPFNVTRPTRLRAANLQVTTTAPFVEIPLTLLEDTEWMAIPVKAITGTYPTKVWYERTHPNGTLHFWPIPTSGLNVVLDYETQLAQFVNLTDTFTFPPGYFEAIYQNLALRLCTPEWGLNDVPSSIQRLANESRSRIQSINVSPPPEMTNDYGNQQVRGEKGYRNLYNPAPIWTR